MSITNQRIITFLTFSGNAAEAVNFYLTVFSDSKILSLTKIDKDTRGEEGKILNCTFELMGQQFMAMDLEKEYAPVPSWSTSLYVDCIDEQEFDMIFEKLSAGGKVLMGPEPIFELKKVAWVSDRFDVTWQLVLGSS